MPEIAVLIPAYDEAPRIEVVLDTVCGMGDGFRVVVIDDGSRDDTAARALNFPVEVLRHPDNLGKGAALETGIIHVGRADRWVFLDADLIDLCADHVGRLLDSLDSSGAGMSVGRFTEGRKKVDWAQRFFAILNGQRALRGDVVEMLPGLSWSRFGVEVFLSQWVEHRGLGIATPILRGLNHHTKEQKMGLAAGIGARLNMYGECIRAYRRWRAHIDEPRITRLDRGRCEVLRAAR
ncbi:MAG: glycosyltransferase [Bacillota bacterium]